MTSSPAFPTLIRIGLSAFLTIVVTGCVSVTPAAQYCPIPAGSRPVASDTQTTTPAANQ